MPVGDPGLGAAAIATLPASEAKSLRALADAAASQVRGCSAAVALMWRGGELAALAASHPDAAALAEAGSGTVGAAGAAPLPDGPLGTVLLDGQPVSCVDTLSESRWPRWSGEALRRGVRSAVCLAGRFPGEPGHTLILALFGVCPGALDADAIRAGQELARAGGTALANVLAYGEARRTATQLQDSVAARSLTDQAKGILMHALGCDAGAALAYLRQESQRRHVKVTEIAARVIEAHTGGGAGPA